MGALAGGCAGSPRPRRPAAQTRNGRPVSNESHLPPQRAGVAAALQARAWHGATRAFVGQLSECHIVFSKNLFEEERVHFLPGSKRVKHVDRLHQRTLLVHHGLSPFHTRNPSLHTLLLVLVRFLLLISCVVTAKHERGALVQAHVGHVVHCRLPIQVLDLFWSRLRHLITCIPPTQCPTTSTLYYVVQPLKKARNRVTTLHAQQVRRHEG